MIERKDWAELYRPATLDECILPEKTREQLKTYLAAGQLPKLLFSGPSGIGKTTAARVLVNALGAEMMFLNGSLEGNIDTLRTKVQQFASTISINGNRKYVIMDEADGLSPATQNGLRAFMDEFEANCGFILTCNYKEKLLKPIAESRLTEISFVFSADERPKLAKALYQLLLKIFTEKGIEYDVKAVQSFIINHLNRDSDIRRLLNQAQKASLTGKFDATLLLVSLDERFQSLLPALKNKDFKSAREWIGHNSDIEPDKIYRYLYDNGKSIMAANHYPALVLILAKYQFQQSFVVDREINLAACMVDIMTECL